MNTGSVGAHRMTLNSSIKLLIIRTSRLIRGRCCFSLELIYHDVKQVLSASFIFCYMNIMQTKWEAGHHSSFRCCHRLKHRGTDRHTRKVNFSKRKCVCVRERKEERNQRVCLGVLMLLSYRRESHALYDTLHEPRAYNTHIKTHAYTHTLS